MKILKTKSGVSLMFVLATMMLLMVIGVSAIVAAGYNVGAGVVQHNRTQLELYSSSMERTIKAAFANTEDTGTLLTETETLGGQILHEAINQSIIFPTGVGVVTVGPVLVPVNIEIRLSPPEPLEPVTTLPEGIDVRYDLLVEGNLIVFVNSFQRYQAVEVFVGVSDDDEPVYVYINATPMTATITGDITVRLVTTFTPVGGMNQEELVPYTFESATTYRLDTVNIIENPDPFSDPFDEENESDPGIGDMRIDSPLVWTVIRYESFGW